MRSPSASPGSLATPYSPRTTCPAGQKELSKRPSRERGAESCELESTLRSARYSGGGEATRDCGSAVLLLAPWSPPPPPDPPPPMPRAPASTNPSQDPQPSPPKSHCQRSSTRGLEAKANLFIRCRVTVILSFPLW
ncbi:homeobox protein Hox-D3-like [Sarcophilus harrisii]|uniref:homeobox protein Hox-D3-like n=1 Tax=Sarcophilus harrisii TaxID=9305 RepID=UPI001301F503|nr:homeobox protein Hox-D3-like [Sarcophilus harrisii]